MPRLGLWSSRGATLLVKASQPSAFPSSSQVVPLAFASFLPFPFSCSWLAVLAGKDLCLVDPTQWEMPLLREPSCVGCWWSPGGRLAPCCWRSGPKARLSRSSCHLLSIAEPGSESCWLLPGTVSTNITGKRGLVASACWMELLESPWIPVCQCRKISFEALFPCVWDLSWHGEACSSEAMLICFHPSQGLSKAVTEKAQRNTLFCLQSSWSDNKGLTLGRRALHHPPAHQQTEPFYFLLGVCFLPGFGFTALRRYFSLARFCANSMSPYRYL